MTDIPFYGYEFDCVILAELQRPIAFHRPFLPLPHLRSISRGIVALPSFQQNYANLTQYHLPIVNVKNRYYFSNSNGT